jgi:hypothetical protein
MVAWWVRFESGEEKVAAMPIATSSEDEDRARACAEWWDSAVQPKAPAHRSWAVLVIIAGVAIMRGSVMPWVTVNLARHASLRVAGTKAGAEFTPFRLGDGWLSFALGLLLVTIGGRFLSGPPRWLSRVAMPVALASLGFTVLEISRSSGALYRVQHRAVAAAHPALSSQLGSGLMVLLVSSVVAVVATVKIKAA